MLTDPISEQDHIQGPNKAPVTLVEYGDYQCPYCGAAYPVIKQIQEYFGPNLKFVFRNFPLTEVHPMAESAAETAEYAGAQGKFWEMHDLLYENQQNFSLELFMQLAATLNLPQERLKDVLQKHTYESKIRKDFMSGVRSGVNGTPTLFINGARYNGPVGFEPLVITISEVVKRSAA